MKYMAKYSRVYWDNDVKPIQKQCQQTLYAGELCSIACMNNYALSENILSSNTIASKGFFQTAAQKALQNSQIDEAFKIAEQYVEVTKRKFFRFIDKETGKIIIVKALNRFDRDYVHATEQKLKGLQNIGRGHSLMHITLTISHTQNTDYILKYRMLKAKFNDFMCFYRRTMKKNIDYVSTYEVTQAKDGQYHQHIHLIIIDQGYLSKKIVGVLSAKWKKITNSKYIYFKYISGKKDIDIFSYVMKYVSKEFDNFNLTTILLFSIKGKAYTMSQSISKLMAVKTIDIGQKKYTYIDAFEAQDIFYGYDISDYDPASLTFFFSFISVEEKTKLLSEAQQQAEARQKIRKETEERDERDIEMNKKNAFTIQNTIKIK